MIWNLKVIEEMLKEFIPRHSLGRAVSLGKSNTPLLVVVFAARGIYSEDTERKAFCPLVHSLSSLNGQG